MSKVATRSWAAREALARREPFETYGALRAEAGGSWSTGRLPEPWREQYLNAWRDNAITYTVYSYRTPIAWVLESGEVITPDVKYSPTTTNHQGMLYALNQPAEALADAAARERQTARERRARAREDAECRRHTPPGHYWNGSAYMPYAPNPNPADEAAEVRRRIAARESERASVDYAPVRMEYSESYSVRQGWATSYVDQPASGV